MTLARTDGINCFPRSMLYPSRDTNSVKYMGNVDNGVNGGMGKLRSLLGSSLSKYIPGFRCCVCSSLKFVTGAKARAEYLTLHPCS